MVSSIVLVQLSNRLKEIKGSSQDFGGVNALVFGDLLQWPPVRAPPVFKGVNSYMARKFFGGRASGVNKWRQFKFYELTENVRQADDVEFANLLNRMRVGTMTDADISVLKAREIPNPHNHPAMENAASYYVDLMKQDPFAMTLLPMVDQVSLFNEMVMQRLGGTIFILNASDSFLKSNPRKCTRPWQLAKYNINVTTRRADDVADDGIPETAGGLRKTLRLAIGCRVMLKRNVDRVKGFVNGLTGVLERFEEVNGEVWKLGVRLVKQAHNYLRAFPICGLLQTEQAEERVQDDGREVAGGLRKTLRLAIGCRVILKRNVDRVNGLVNGLNGVLEAIEERDGNAWKLGVRKVN
ncbi:hypothetical protein B9Z55_000602 [Caenorhabditis nigoni]|uniref:Uncharacterized protein n=1 Tax=Caenorhabditis nigoni TaxID=1611254 RepID=A0A2G5VTU7_9PELO|nr:hypothetical protein B9Z55_000602 [Caenorhabditis nigoni]